MALACIICTEDLCSNEENKPVNIKTCGHVFHDSCLRSWLRTSHTCPICRQITLDSPAHIGKLHFQINRLSIGEPTRLLKQLLDENAELLKKEEAWKAKENEYRDREKATQHFLRNINEDLKQMEAIREKISSYTRAMIKPIEAGSKAFAVATSGSSTVRGASTSSNRRPAIATISLPRVPVSLSTSRSIAASTSGVTIRPSSSAARSIEASTSGVTICPSSSAAGIAVVSRARPRVTVRTRNTTTSASSSVTSGTVSKRAM